MATVPPCFDHIRQQTSRLWGLIPAPSARSCRGRKSAASVRHQADAVRVDQATEASRGRASLDDTLTTVEKSRRPARGRLMCHLANRRNEPPHCERLDELVMVSPIPFRRGGVAQTVAPKDVWHHLAAQTAVQEQVRDRAGTRHRGHPRHLPAPSRSQSPPYRRPPPPRFGAGHTLTPDLLKNGWPNERRGSTITSVWRYAGNRRMVGNPSSPHVMSFR